MNAWVPFAGHVHTPDDRMIEGIHYLNDGDWVESCTALVEHHDGRFEIISWHGAKAPVVRAAVDEEADEPWEVPITALLF